MTQIGEPRQLHGSVGLDYHSGNLRNTPRGEAVHHVVWTERGDRIRIISLRKANARETKNYAEGST